MNETHFAMLCRYIDADFRWTCNVSRQSYDVILAKRYCVRLPVFQVNNNELSTGWVIPPWELHFYVQLSMIHLCYCQLRSWFVMNLSWYYETSLLRCYGHSRNTLKVSYDIMTSAFSSWLGEYFTLKLERMSASWYQTLWCCFCVLICTKTQRKLNEYFQLLVFIV